MAKEQNLIQEVPFSTKENLEQTEHLEQLLQEDTGIQKVIELVRQKPTMLQAIQKAAGIKEATSPTNDMAQAIVEGIAKLIQNQKQLSTGEMSNSLSMQLQQSVARVQNTSQQIFAKLQKEIESAKDHDELFISENYRHLLPTYTSVHQDDPQKSQTWFKIAFNGVIWKFELHVTYSKTPLTIVRFITRKIAQYVSNISISNNKQRTTAFDMVEQAF